MTKRKLKGNELFDDELEKLGELTRSIREIREMAIVLFQYWLYEDEMEKQVIAPIIVKGAYKTLNRIISSKLAEIADDLDTIKSNIGNIKE